MITTSTGTSTGYRRRLKSILGELPIASLQAQKLAVQQHSQLSPDLESCCLRVSANVSYERAAEDIEYFTGMEVSKSVQQRLVHRQDFVLPEAESALEKLSVDGGNIRIRTPKGQPCTWRGYKAVCLHELLAVAASFQDNGVVINWVNAQPRASVLSCIGDRPDGIWNIISQFAPNTQRREVLDWFHLMENLHKVGWSIKRLNQAQNLLWQGQVEAAIALFADFDILPPPTASRSGGGFPRILGSQINEAT